MNYSRALQRGINHQHRLSLDPPIKRAFAAVANKFGDAIIAVDENPRRDIVEIAIQFKKDVDIHNIVEEGFVIGDKIVPTHLLLDIANTTRIPSNHGTL
ncbi:uncharacterized protein VTP21DRAFT_6239 [Calcarisporiella thermophila]|uniref:uncharacterized protein n=1 Tax=Calcarisporiella thermophila TaxID=911321 RepID=UPI003743E86E